MKSLLKEDLKNIPLHVLGFHEKCKDYYCAQDTTTTTVFVEKQNHPCFYRRVSETAHQKMQPPYYQRYK